MSLEELQALKAEMLKHRSNTSATKTISSRSKSLANLSKTTTSEAKGTNNIINTFDDDLTLQVQAHVEEFLASTKRYFSNERDIQVRLANWLQSQKDKKGNFYDFVDTEYGVPLSVLAEKLESIEFPRKEGQSWTTPESFPWHNNLSIDLVVCKGGKWVAIELKYATRRIKEDRSIFGEIISNQGVLANQATANLAMYGYWKDVRRLEMLCHRFQNVVGGVAIMVSNNSDCWNKPHESSLYSEFSMHIEPGKEHYVGGKVLRWKEGTSDTVADGHPSFFLEGMYPCSWNDTGIEAKTNANQPFKYMITNINKPQ